MEAWWSGKPIPSSFVKRFKTGLKTSQQFYQDFFKRLFKSLVKPERVQRWRQTERFQGLFNQVSLPTEILSEPVEHPIQAVTKHQKGLEWDHKVRKGFHLRYVRETWSHRGSKFFGNVAGGYFSGHENGFLLRCKRLSYLFLVFPSVPPSLTHLSQFRALCSIN